MAQHNPRHTIMAAELAAGKTVEQAMLAAGYAAKTASKGVILHPDGGRRSPREHPAVATMLAELQAEGRRQAAVTVGDIVERLEEAYESAKEKEQPASMVAAAMSMAKVLGLIVDRKQLALTRPIATWSEEECLAALGAAGTQEDVHH